MLAIKKFVRRLSQLPTALTRADKIIILISLAILAVGAFRKFQPPSPPPKAAYGGVFIEGIVAQSTQEVDRDIERLTMASLVRFNDQRQLLPYLADSWSGSDDGKVYTFYLNKGVNAQSLVDQYNARLDRLPGTKWQAKDQQTLTIELNQPYGLLLENLTKLYFSSGPYQVVKKSSQTLELTANELFVLGKPFIPKILINIYPDDSRLQQALRRHEVMGGLTNSVPDSSFQSSTLSLPRYIFVFFNVKREPFNDKPIRQKLAEKKSLDQPINFTLTYTNEPLSKKLADELSDSWKLLGAQATRQILNQADFKSKILEHKDYQALIYGVDFGRDADEYPFWHSSQTSSAGQNIAQFANQTVDKLLEEYRLTNDESVRSQKYEELRKVLNEERPALQLEQVKYTYQLSKQIKGAKIDQGVTTSDRFQNAWQWYIKVK